MRVNETKKEVSVASSKMIRATEIEQKSKCVWIHQKTSVRTSESLDHNPQFLYYSLSLSRYAFLNHFEAIRVMFNVQFNDFPLCFYMRSGQHRMT